MYIHTYSLYSFSVIVAHACCLLLHIQPPQYDDLEAILEESVYIYMRSLYIYIYIDDRGVCVYIYIYIDD